jgi:hypothetical protein
LRSQGSRFFFVRKSRSKLIHQIVSSLIVQRWLQTATAAGLDTLLDAHFGLMFKLKKDSTLANQSVRFRLLESIL